MKNLRSSRKKVIILILIFIIILFFIYKIAKLKNSNFQEDLIFFKLLGVGSIENIANVKQQENTNVKNLEKIEVFKNHKNYQKLNLFQTVDLKTLVNEKIAPGSNGYFYIYLISNSDLDYEIDIIIKN